MESRVSQLCGIKYPLLLGPMLGISTAPLVAAFSQAGGLGCLASARMAEDEFREQIALVRRQTDSPFAVNIAWAAPNAEKVVPWCLEENIEIVISSAGSPREHLDRMKKARIKVFQVVANVAQAERAQSLGLEGVIAKGYESGGLNSLEAVTTMALIPQVADSVSIPVIAAGGIGDGRGLAAALALGAEGVLMGTRFLVSRECLIHDNYKEALIRAGDTDTTGVSFPSFSVRMLKNRLAVGLKGDEPLWQLDSDPRDGEDVENKLMGAGQIAGLLKASSPVREIFNEILLDFKKAVERLQKMRNMFMT